MFPEVETSYVADSFTRGMKSNEFFHADQQTYTTAAFYKL